MKINLAGLGKRYNSQWIFRNLNFQFHPDKRYAITGPNGSGKSTLLQIIGSAITYNEGNIIFEESGKEISQQNLFTKISLAAPYLELVEEMTLEEFFSFHYKMKGLIASVTITDIIKIIGLEKFSGMQLRYFSSGMKQRAKLAQAIFSDVPVVLLDEPLTNLDDNGIELYYSLIKNYCSNRLLIISSNDKSEYSFCEEIIDITNYK